MSKCISTVRREQGVREGVDLHTVAVSVGATTAAWNGLAASTVCTEVCRTVTTLASNPFRMRSNERP
jgi:hypothetical protein